MGITGSTAANDFTSCNVFVPYSTEPCSIASIDALLKVQQYFIIAQLDDALSPLYQIQTPWLDCLSIDVSFTVKIDTQNTNSKTFKVCVDRRNCDLISIEPIPGWSPRNTYDPPDTFHTTKGCTKVECEKMVEMLNTFARGHLACASHGLNRNNTNTVATHSRDLINGL